MVKSFIHEKNSVAYNKPNFIICSIISVLDWPSSLLVSLITAHSPQVLIEMMIFFFSSLKQKVQELSSRPAQKKTPTPPSEPPKPKVIIEQVPTADVVGLQHTVATVRYLTTRWYTINDIQLRLCMRVHSRNRSKARLEPSKFHTHKSMLSIDRSLAIHSLQKMVGWRSS